MGYKASMRRAKQLEFDGFKRPGDSFGGALLKGNPKGKRPLSSKYAVHLTLRGVRSGLRDYRTIKLVNSTVARTAKKYGVRIYAYSNVHNHLHVLIRVTKLRLWAAFIRELTGRIALVMQDYLKDLESSYWKFRPHTRIVRSWKKAYRVVKSYIRLNELEAADVADRHEIAALKSLQRTLTKSTA